MLYLVTKESFGFETIFDALATGRGGVGRNRDTIIEDPAIPDIPGLLFLGWSEERPLGPRNAAPFLGRPDSDRPSIFVSLLVDENITSVADFVEYGYAIYELAPGGDLIRLSEDGTPMSENTDPERPNPFLPDGVENASLSDVMIGPFSIIALNLRLESLSDINGATIALIPGSAIESAVNALYADLGFTYTAVAVPDVRGATVAFQSGVADLFIYPTRLLDESVLDTSYQVLGFDGRVSAEPILGTPQADTLNGTAGDDLIRGLEEADILRGLDGNDTLMGGDGSDTLNGGDGDDFIFGGSSPNDLRDVIFGGAGNDRVDAGAGNDEVFGQDGNDTIAGGAGVNTLQGQEGDDVITGSNFSDLIFGNAGDDFVNGGFGSDRINGGTGADRFFHVGDLGHGSDWVQDYTSAEGDILLYGGTATRDQFQVNFANTAGAGDAGVAEAFVIFRPTDQILWALVDGAGEDEIILRLNGQEFDLLA